MAVTRTIDRWMAWFDDAGNLVKFGVHGDIRGDEQWKDHHGNTKGIEDEQWLEVMADDEDLPPQFIADLEAMHAQIVTKVDAKHPIDVP